MKGSPAIIQALNEVLAVELTAINQYFLHGRTLVSWGYHSIGGKVTKESIEEMEHAQTLVDRILFLEGLPNLQKYLKINAGENVEEMLKSDLKLETEGRIGLMAGIDVATKERDNVTRVIFEGILKDSENHIDWIEAQIKIISDIGVQNYLAQQIKPESK